MVFLGMSCVRIRPSGDKCQVCLHRDTESKDLHSKSGGEIGNSGRSLNPFSTEKFSMSKLFPFLTAYTIVEACRCIAHIGIGNVVSPPGTPQGKPIRRWSPFQSQSSLKAQKAKSRDSHDVWRGKVGSQRLDGMKVVAVCPGGESARASETSAGNYFQSSIRNQPRRLD